MPGCAQSVRSRPVDFDLSDDQEALQSAAAALLDSRSTLEQVRKVADNPGHIDRALWAQMAEQGWLAIERPEASGGLGMGFVEVAVLSEQIGRHLAPVPFAGTVLALHAIETADSDGYPLAGLSIGGLRRSELVERLSSGEAIGAIAWTRRPDQVVGERSTGAADGWVLPADPTRSVFGPVADVVIVPAEIAGSPGVRASLPRREST